MREDFAIFIISHERANSLSTLKTIKSTNKVYIVVDDEDRELDTYLKNFPLVKVFNKKQIKCDNYLSKFEPNSALYARCYCEQLAKELNLKYFLVLDDDIKNFYFRGNLDGHLKAIKVNNFDSIVDVYLDLLDSTNVGMLGFGNGTSYFGGIACFENDCKRRCFGAFFRKTSIDFKWECIMNEDYISCVRNGQLGFVALELMGVQLDAETKEKKNGNKQLGGLSSSYKEFSDFRRAYMAVVSNPSCFKATKNKQEKYIIKCSWDYAIPKLVSSKNQRR